MPGAFAHITAINIAMSPKKLQPTNIPDEAKLALCIYTNFVELGCASPDYPYLKLADKAQNIWADKMHYENVSGFIKSGVNKIKTLSGEEQKKAFAWLCGFVGHVISDITIHPVVELKVGKYDSNQKCHRICEMHQDSYIWKRLNLGEIGYADRVRENIGKCHDENNKQKLDRTIHELWFFCLSESYTQYINECEPNIDAWHQGFLSVVDNVDEGYRLFPFARHVATNLGLMYPLESEVDFQYILNLQTPCGKQNYDAVFDLAVSNITRYWCDLSNAVFNNGSTDMFHDWNLDTGMCERGNMTAWSQ